MRNIPIDVSRFTFVCVSEARPKLVSMETGEIKVDRDGNTIYSVGISAANVDTGRAELMNVSITGDPRVPVGSVVRMVGLVAMPWEQTRNGRLMWGIAFRVDSIAPATQVKAA